MPENQENIIENNQENNKETKEKKKFQEVETDHTQVENLDEYLNMDIRAGVSKEAEKISANPYLSRGISAYPNPECKRCRRW